MLLFFLKISFMNTIFCHQIHSLPSSNSCSPPSQLAFFSFHFLFLETKFNPSLLYLIILILLIVIIASSFSFFIFFSILPSLPLPPPLLLFLLWWVLENVTSDYNTEKRNILSSWNHYLSKAPHDLLGNHEPLPLCWRVQSCTGKPLLLWVHDSCGSCFIRNTVFNSTDPYPLLCHSCYTLFCFVPYTL